MTDQHRPNSASKKRIIYRDKSLLRLSEPKQFEVLTFQRLHGDRLRDLIEVPQSERASSSCGQECSHCSHADHCMRAVTPHVSDPLPVVEADIRLSLEESYRPTLGTKFLFREFSFDVESGGVSMLRPRHALGLVEHLQE